MSSRSDPSLRTERERKAHASRAQPLFGYQVAGSSSQELPDWRRAEQDLISDVQLLDRTFPGGRPTKSGKHHKWDKLFIRGKPADNDQE